MSMFVDRQQAERIEAILMPHASGRLKELNQGGLRLAHYTTAEAALKIIHTRTLWLRNARNMHDFSEVLHGHEQLRRCFDHAHKGDRFRNALNACLPTLGDTVIKEFNNWWNSIQGETYIACFSEHKTSEDEHGRLSMWRGFASGSAGVAMVMRPPDSYAALPLRVVMSPVAYFSPTELSEEIERVITNIEQNVDWLKGLQADYLVGVGMMVLMMAVTSLKHPGFYEEEEWRLIYSPSKLSSPFVVRATETINGIPQVIHKIPLENKPIANINGVEIPQLIERIIIGPTPYGGSIRAAIVQALHDVGVANAESKVINSGIPLRG